MAPTKWWKRFISVVDTKEEIRINDCKFILENEITAIFRWAKNAFICEWIAFAWTRIDMEKSLDCEMIVIFFCSKYLFVAHSSTFWVQLFLFSLVFRKQRSADENVLIDARKSLLRLIVWKVCKAIFSSLHWAAAPFVHIFALTARNNQPRIK